MKRTVLIVPVAALCVAGSAVAQDRSGQTVGSGSNVTTGANRMAAPMPGFAHDSRSRTPGTSATRDARMHRVFCTKASLVRGGTHPLRRTRHGRRIRTPQKAW